MWLRARGYGRDLGFMLTSWNKSSLKFEQTTFTHLCWAARTLSSRIASSEKQNVQSHPLWTYFVNDEQFSPSDTPWAQMFHSKSSFPLCTGRTKKKKKKRESFSANASKSQPCNFYKWAADPPRNEKLRTGWPLIRGPFRTELDKLCIRCEMSR